MDFQILFENLYQLLFYHPKQPILFNSGQFLLFFTLFLAVYVLIYQKINLRLFWLTAFSLFFYYKSSGAFVALLGGTILVNFGAALLIHKVEEQWKRNLILLLTIMANLGALFYFKYSNFFLENWKGLWNISHDPIKIFLPIGISFFTFQTISYIVDVYKKEIKPCYNLLDFAFYLSFFPQLVAGPIVRAQEFLPQIRKKIEWEKDNIGEGLFLVLKGFVKKAIIADYVAQYADLIYGNPMGYSGFENWMGMYAYTLQIYCDFSGYSDMAIGLAMVLGYRLPDNFKSPYQSLDITEFWRRWHISLSFWLRDYIYIPLGGNRGGGFASIVLMVFFMLISVLITGLYWLLLVHVLVLIAAYFYCKGNREKTIQLFMYCNLMLTMLIGGWWHGANWKFVFWGLMHGVGLIVHKLISDKTKRFKWNRAGKFLSWFVTFHFVAFLWVYFRASSFDEATLSIQKMFFDFDWAYFQPFLEVRPLLLAMLLMGFGIHFISLKDKELMSNYFGTLPILAKTFLFLLAIQIWIQLQNADVQTFIYFQF